MKTTWHLMIGKKSIPVTILWTTKGNALVKLGQSCDRGDAGENVYIASKDLKIDHDALAADTADSDGGDRDVQLSLF